MMKTKFRDAGQGKFVLEDQVLAEVEYTLRVWRRYHISRAGGVEEEVPGLFDSEGSWRTVGEPCEALKQNLELVLELADGRRVPAQILQSMWGNEGTFYLRGKGDLELSGDGE